MGASPRQVFYAFRGKKILSDWVSIIRRKRELFNFLPVCPKLLFFY